MRFALISIGLLVLSGCRYADQKTVTINDDFSKKTQCERLALEYQNEEGARLHSDPDRMDKGFFIVEKSFYSVSRNSCLCVGKYQTVKLNNVVSDLTLRDLLSREDLWHGIEGMSIREPDIDKVVEKYK